MSLFKGAHHQKYAKWKAAYIHKCLKTGETPIPGPAGGDDDSFNEEGGEATPYPPPTNMQQPPYPAGNTMGIPGQFPSQPYPPNQPQYPTPHTQPSTGIYQVM